MRNTSLSDFLKKLLRVAISSTLMIKQEHFSLNQVYPLKSSNIEYDTYWFYWIGFGSNLIGTKRVGWFFYAHSELSSLFFFFTLLLTFIKNIQTHAQDLCISVCRHCLL